MTVLSSAIIATFFALLPFLFIPPKIGITNATCKIVNYKFDTYCNRAPCCVEGIKLIYEDKETNWQINDWNQSEGKVNCHFLSNSPSILRYGYEVSSFKSNPILLNIGMATAIWISVFFQSYLGIEIRYPYF